MFSNHYLVPDSPPTALLDRVRKGCVSVTWLVPLYLTKQLAERVKVDPELLQRYRIVKVTVKGDVVYQEAVQSQFICPVTVHLSSHCSSVQSQFLHVL